jgi:hypothetical protein
MSNVAEPPPMYPGTPPSVTFLSGIVVAVTGPIRHPRQGFFRAA